MPPKNVPTVKNSARASTSKSGNYVKVPVSKTASIESTMRKVSVLTTIANEDTKSSKKECTVQEKAALRIQSKFRQFLAKALLSKKKTEKEIYEERMQELEREAYLYLIKLEQEENERKRKKEELERQRKQEENKRRKRMLEAAFDGDVKTMKQVLKEISELDDKDEIGHDVIGKAVRTKHKMDMIDCEDANGNTALSEAANGGHVSAIKFLLDHGADPNTKGQFMRTPLYRAAFAGHMAAVQALLEHGADPRIYASDNQCPAEIAATPAIKEIIQNWDIGHTETTLQKLEAAKAKRAEEDQLKREAETSKLDNIVAEAKKDYKSKQKMLDHAYSELNKRIAEHDKCVAQGFDKTEITLQSIHDQEFEVDIMKQQVVQARDHLAKARLRLREKMAESEEDAEDNLPGVKVTIRELDDVLFRDVGNKIKNSGKWPLLIDITSQASTFLRYRDTNYINAVRPADMQLNNIRLSLLGAIRYGKPFILDMMEVDMFDTCVDLFDGIMKGLMASIIDKSILDEKKYMKLVKAQDGSEYDKTKFNDLRMSHFKFVLVTKNPFPDEKLLEKFYVIRIIINT